MPASDGVVLTGNSPAARRALVSGDRLPQPGGMERGARITDAVVDSLAQPGVELGDWWSQQGRPDSPGFGAAISPLAMAASNVLPGPKGMGAAYRGIEAATPALSRVSTRLPTAVKSVENVLGPERLQIGTDAMRMEPKVWSNVDLVNDYPGFKSSNPADRDVTAREFIDHVKSNLLYLHDSIAPEIRDRSSKWYDGGRGIVDQMSQRYGTHPHSSAAAIAALSPQKDWFQNVDLANRVHHIVHNANDIPYTPEMTQTAPRIFGDPKFATGLERIQGKAYRDLTDPSDKAMWLRLYDEAHHDRSYNVLTPEGKFSHVATNADGSNSDVAWGSLGEIGKAIQALEAKGDLERISPLLGERHKVRNFYNNLIDPNAASGDVTIDTHAVAAGLMRPLSGNSLEAAHNFASYPGAGLPTAKGSSVSGAHGTYGLYADAYREAAAERGILPRQMQSITWEGLKGLFPDKFKANKRAVEDINSLWRQYETGAASLDDTRKSIMQRAGGIDAPKWHGRGSGRGSALNEAGRYSGESQKLPGSGVPDRAAATVDRRARGGASPGAPGLQQGGDGFRLMPVDHDPFAQ
jgi:hypothetical protein